MKQVKAAKQNNSWSPRRCLRGSGRMLSMLWPEPHSTSSPHGLISDSCQWGPPSANLFSTQLVSRLQDCTIFSHPGCKTLHLFLVASWGFSLSGLQSINILLQGSPVLQHTDCSSHFGAICQLVEGVFYPIIPAINRCQCRTVPTPSSVPGKHHE